MRRAAARLVLQAISPAQRDAALPAIQAAASACQHTRQMSGHPETPLTKVMPPLVALPRQVIGTALSLTGKLIVGAATSGAVKSVVTSFAEEVILKEQFVKLTELDVPYWAYWLSTTGYTSPAGFKRFAEAALPAVPGLDAQQITNLVEGFHTAGLYDKALFAAVSTNISANFTKFETDQLLKVLSAFSDFGHYQSAVFDDIGDSITYANHYLAPIRAPVGQVAKALATYAKFGHERADLFLTLSRGISELALGALDKPARKAAVVDALTAFKKFNFYPEQVDALLYYTESESDLFSTDELALASSVKAAVESQTGGKLSVYRENDDEDAAHWYAHHLPHAPAHHELYVFREALVPKSYSPQAFRAGK